MERERGVTYLPKPLRLGVFLKAESGEMHARAEDFRFCQDGNTTHAIELHLHIWIAVWISQVSQVRSPRSIFSVALHNDGIFIKCICQTERRL